MKPNYLLITLLLIISNMLGATEYAPANVEMELKKVSEHVYYAEGAAGMATDNHGFISNASAIITDKEVIVVDALGTPSLASLFLEKLKTVTDKPVTKVIVTHYHADHIYGLQAFKKQGAEIIAPKGHREYLDAPIAEERLEERRLSLDPWVTDDTYLVKPDTVLDEDTTLKIGDIEIEIGYLGKAHSDGDFTVLVKPDQVLISGDLIFEGRVPFTGSADTARWLTLLEKLDNTGIKALIPGHGPAAKKPDEAVKLTLNYLKTTRKAMEKGIDEMMDFDEAYAAADWSEFNRLPAFDATHRRNAYGVYLSVEKALLDN